MKGYPKNVFPTETVLPHSHLGAVDSWKRIAHLVVCFGHDLTYHLQGYTCWFGRMTKNTEHAIGLQSLSLKVSKKKKNLFKTVTTILLRIPSITIKSSSVSRSNEVINFKWSPGFLPNYKRRNRRITETPLTVFILWE